MGSRWILMITTLLIWNYCARQAETACQETKLPRDCESLCTRSRAGVESCEVRIAVLLPADTTYDVSLSKVLPVLGENEKSFYRNDNKNDGIIIFFK